MTLGDRLVQHLTSCPPIDGARIDAWRFEIVQTDTLRVGVRDGALGGPYEAPSVATRRGGSVELRWSDGRVTRATLTRDALACLPSAVAAWRAEATSLERRAPVAPPAACPRVETFDARVAEIAHGNGGQLIDLTMDARDALRARGVERPDLTVAAGVGRRRVVTSGGFDLAWDETTCSLDLSAEDLHGASFSARRWPTDDVAVNVALLRREDALSAEPRGVLFAPSLVDALLTRFLSLNLDGRAIERGRSRFSLDDLAEYHLVLRSDFDLSIDTTLPLELAASPCSAEGVPGGRVALIGGGRLMTPRLSREWAARLGRPPTPVSRGRPSLLLSSSATPPDLDAALDRLGDGLLVRSLLGLHTQAARRGDVVQMATGAQVVRDGRLAGRADVLLRFNAFALLNAPDAALVRFPTSITPGLLARSGVELQPG